MSTGRLRVLYVEDNDFTRREVVRQLRAADPLLDVRAAAGVLKGTPAERLAGVIRAAAEGSG